MKFGVLALGFGGLAFLAFSVWTVRRFIEQAYERPDGWATAVEYDQ